MYFTDYDKTSVFHTKVHGANGLRKRGILSLFQGRAVIPHVAAVIPKTVITFECLNAYTVLDFQISHRCGKN